MQGLDDRIVRIGIEIDSQIKWYEGLYVTVSGTKYANPIQNDCEIKIDNLARATRDYLLTITSPFQQAKVRKQVIVQAGRKSYGVATIFRGDIISSVGGQPPDISITLKAQTGNYDKGNIVSRPQGGQVSMRTVANSVAADLGLKLDFQAKDKNLGNHSFTGAALKQVDKLSETGGVNAYVDDDRLVVKDYNVPLSGRVRDLSLSSGMIGIPEFTEQGVKVKFLLDNQTTLGSGLKITSVVNPAANGTYVVYKLGFEIASRDTPFYYTAEAKRAS